MSHHIRVYYMRAVATRCGPARPHLARCAQGWCVVKPPLPITGRLHLPTSGSTAHAREGRAAAWLGIALRQLRVWELERFGVAGS